MGHDKLAHAVKLGAADSLVEAVWYLALAGCAWLLFYVLLHRVFQPRRICLRPLGKGQIPREILTSLRSLVIFGIVTGIVVLARLHGGTRLYRHGEHHNPLWFYASIGVMIVMHDTYFYWTHRLIHHRRLYKLFHRTHHLSVNPTPWAAYAFSPWEALVQAGIGPLIVFTLPTPPGAFLLFMTWQIAFNVTGHCGYEIFPRWFLRTPLGMLFNSPTHHTMHHETFRSNYGLYFNVWDRLMSTNHPDYEHRFERATGTARETVEEEALTATQQA